MLDYPVYMVSKFTSRNLKWPFTASKITEVTCTEYGTPTCNAWDSYMFLFMRYNVYNVFIVWPLVIWNGLWLPPKMIQIWYRSSVHFTSWDVLYISFSQFWLWWQLITSVLHQEPLESCTQCGVPSCQSLFFSTIWCPVHVLIQFLCNFL